MPRPKREPKKTCLLFFCCVKIVGFSWIAAQVSSSTFPSCHVTPSNQAKMRRVARVLTVRTGQGRDKLSVVKNACKIDCYHIFGPDVSCTAQFFQESYASSSLNCSMQFSRETCIKMEKLWRFKVHCFRSKFQNDHSRSVESAPTAAFGVALSFVRSHFFRVAHCYLEHNRFSLQYLPPMEGQC